MREAGALSGHPPAAAVAKAAVHRVHEENVMHDRHGTRSGTGEGGASRAGRRERIGTLREDFQSVAARIVSAAQGSFITVWVDDECHIYGARPESVPEVPAHWIVGTYGCGAPLGDIAADLDAERSERSRAFCLD